jgi:uncharacterized protein YjeT (DUF2065 family)
MKEFLVAIGLVLVIEGFMFAASPDRLREALKMIEAVSDNSLKRIGIASMFTGVLLVGAIKTFF